MVKIKSKGKCGVELEVIEIENKKIEITSYVDVGGVTPHQVYDFLVNLNDERYRQWHPKHHKEFRVLYHPEDTIVGAVYYFREKLKDGHIIDSKVKVIEAIPDKYLAEKSLSPWWAPYTLHTNLEQASNGTKVIQKLILGSDLPILGELYNLIAKKLLLNDSFIQALHNHAVEEFKNLKKYWVDEDGKWSIIPGPNSRKV